MDDERKERQEDARDVDNLKHEHKKHNKAKFIMTLAHMFISLITSKIGMLIILVLSVTTLIRRVNRFI